MRLIAVIAVFLDRVIRKKVIVRLACSGPFGDIVCLKKHAYQIYLKGIFAPETKNRIFMKKIRKKIGAILYTCPSGFQYDRWRTLRINHFIDRCEDNSPIIEIGSQERIPGKKIINMDVRFSDNIDVVADGCYLPFKKQSLSGVIARGVLEHIPTPRLVIEEIHRSLRDKGGIYIQVPFIQGYHAGPGDYQRYTLDGLEFLCNSFAKIESGVCGGPSSAMAWILQEFLSQLFSFGNNRLKVLMSFLFGWICFPLRYLDYFMYKNPSAGIISSGVYFWGEKSNESGEAFISRYVEQ